MQPMWLSGDRFSWLKFGLLGSIFLAAGASLGLLYQIDKTRARLEPLSAIVKRNWILGTSAIALVLIAALLWVWNAVWLNQPETLVRFMVAETSTGGSGLKLSRCSGCEALSASYCLAIFYSR